MRDVATRSVFVVILLVLGIAPIRGDQVRVTTGEATVRLRPDSTSPVVATVALGSLLDFRSRVDEWYAVDLPADEQGLRRSGYIAADQVELVGSLLPANTQGKPPISVGSSSSTAQRVLILDSVSRAVGAVDVEKGTLELVGFGPELMPRRGPFDVSPSSGIVVNRGKREDRGTPAEMIVSPDGSRVVAIDHGPGEMTVRFGWRPSRRSSIVVVDAASHERIARPQGVWGLPTLHHVTDDSTRLTLFGPGYRSNGADETRPPELVTIDLRTGQTLGRLDLGPIVGKSMSAEEWAEVTALSPDGQYLYALDRGNASKNLDGRIVVVSTMTGQAVATLAAGSQPRHFVVDRVGGQILLLSDHPPYVKDRERQYGELRVIKAAGIAATIRVEPDPQFLRFSPDREAVYVFSPHAVTRVDAVALRAADQIRVQPAGSSWTGVNYIGGPGTVNDASISPDGKRAYVLHAGSSQLSILDLEDGRRIATVNTGRRSRKILKFAVAIIASAFSESAARQEAIAAGRDMYFYTRYFVLPAETEVAVRPDGRFAYVLNSQTDDVTVIDTEAGRVARHLPMRGTDLQVMPGGDLLGVGNANAMRFVDMRTQIERKELALPGEHIAAAISPDGRRLWILSNKRVSSVDTRTGRLMASFDQFLAPAQIVFRGGSTSLVGPTATVGQNRKEASPPESSPDRESSSLSGRNATTQAALETTQWTVWHLHRTSFCAGWLYVEAGRLGFRSTPDQPHSWEVALASVKEIRPNRLFAGGGGLGSFHIELGDGANYNFSSADSPADRLVSTLAEILERQKREQIRK